jgi:hypothetical protein
LVPVHRADNFRCGFHHQRHPVGGLRRECRERGAGRLLHFRVILVPVHRAEDVRRVCHQFVVVAVVAVPVVPSHQGTERAEGHLQHPRVVFVQPDRVDDAPVRSVK